MEMPIRWDMNNSVCDAYESKIEKSSVLHGHNHFLLTLVTKGRGIQTLNGKEIEFSENDMFLLSPADFHKNTICSGECYEHYCVKFTYELLNSRLSEYCRLERFPMHIRLSEKNAVTAREIFKRLIEEINSGKDKTASDVYKQAMVEQLVIIALREMPEESEVCSGAFINKTLGYIYSHFTENIKVSDIAMYVGYTPNYFSSKFKEYMNVTFGEFLRELRLKYSENLLRSGNMSVTEIAIESGFGSLSLFSRCFRDKYGVSPREYKNK